MKTRGHATLMLTMMGIALTTCSKGSNQGSESSNQDGWVNNDIPSAVAKSMHGAKWLAATGASGYLLVIDPLADSSKIVTKLNLDIDCYVNSVSTANDNVYIAGYPSLSNPDSVGGAYEVDSKTGYSRLIISNKQLNGPLRQLFAMQKSSGEATRIICVNNKGVYVVSTMTGQIEYSTVLDTHMTNWAYVGHNVLVGMTDDQSTFILNVLNGNKKRLAVNWNEIASSSIGDTVIARSGTAWSLWDVSDTSSGSIAYGSTLVNATNIFRPIAVLLPNDSTVVFVTSYELPYGNSWIIGGKSLDLHGFNVQDACLTLQ